MRAIQALAVAVSVRCAIALAQAAVASEPHPPLAQSDRQVASDAVGSMRAATGELTVETPIVVCRDVRTYFARESKASVLRKIASNTCIAGSDDSAGDGEKRGDFALEARFERPPLPPE